MQPTFEIFNELMPELKTETAQKLSNRDFGNLEQTSTYHSALFKPLFDVRKLLHHVTRGEHDAVKAMLKKDLSFFLKTGVVTDRSGREFENISGFEYALWALDKHMWAAMIACIPQNEEGRKVFAKLIAQYNKVNTEGVTYKLNGKIITERHFDFKTTIIKELQTQVDSIDTPGDKNWELIDIQWREGVGGAQLLFPMHVVYEYCSEEPFEPVPKFTSQPKSLNYFYHVYVPLEGSWFSGDPKFAVDFAIFKRDGCSYRWWRANGACALSNLNAMKALSEVRTNDFIALQSQLEGQMTLDYHHPESPIGPN